MTSVESLSALPFAPDELARLEDALSPRTVLQATGFLAAVASIPKSISEQTWLSELLTESVRTDEARLSAVLPLVLRLHLHVRSALFSDEPEAFVPEPEQISAIRELCAGYMDVVDQIDVEGEEEAVLADLFALELLAGRVTDEELKEVIEPGVAIGAYVQRSREELPDMLAFLYETWEPLRRKGLVVRRDAPKIGRNDPCPCGSGKKHKKCCGAALN